MVHPAAAEGFARAADAYERARPGYPAAVVDFVAQHAGRDVVELAAGTGKMTRCLLMAGMRVTAIEPVDEMSAALPSGVNALAGTAEAIPLPSSCADGVVVAQAWHWFEAQRALREIHRVLRELGCLIIVYNRRDMEDPVQRQIEALVAPHRGDAPSYRSHPFDVGRVGPARRVDQLHRGATRRRARARARPGARAGRGGAPLRLRSRGVDAPHRRVSATRNSWWL